MTSYASLPICFLLAILQISNSGSSTNGTDFARVGLIGTHRVIKRFTPRYPFPRPNVPTLPRPGFPLFPMFPPPGHRETGDPTFPKIVIRPPSDENLFTEEEDVSLTKKRKKKAKAKRPQRPQQEEPTESVAEDDAKVHLKGESGELPKTKKKNKRQKTTPKYEAIAEPVAQQDRMLLAAKKALLLKKAIILAKLKKKAFIKSQQFATAAALAYGINKASKLKGFKVKAPGVVFSVGAPANVAAAAAAAAAVEEEALEEDEEAADLLDEIDEAIEDELDEIAFGEGETDGVDSVEIVPETGEDGSESMKMNISGMAVAMMPTMKPMQQYSNSMMQQLQQQLQEKQQQQQMTSENSKEVMLTSAEMPQKPMTPQQVTLYTQKAQQQPQIQAPQITVDLILPTSAPPPPPPLPVDVELYTGSKSSKASKKAKKKGKPKPRPVNLGVKANLYKKFNQLAKQAQSKLSTFIQIDVDLYRKGITEDRNEQDKLMSRTLEVSEEGEVERSDSPINAHGGKVQVPDNFFPPWVDRQWEDEYPRLRCGRNRPCNLTPVWIVMSKDRIE